MCICTSITSAHRPVFATSVRSSHLLATLNRCLATSAHISKSRPDSGLVLSHDSAERPLNISCSFHLARQGERHNDESDTRPSTFGIACSFSRLTDSDLTRREDSASRNRPRGVNHGVYFSIRRQQMRKPLYRNNQGGDGLVPASQRRKYFFNMVLDRLYDLYQARATNVTSSARLKVGS